MERADDEAAGRYRARLYAAREKAAGATEERDQAVKERDEAKGEGDSLALAHEKGGLGPVQARDSATPACGPQRTDQEPQGEHRADCRLGVLPAAAEQGLVAGSGQGAADELDGPGREPHRAPGCGMAGRNLEGRRRPPGQRRRRVRLRDGAAGWVSAPGPTGAGTPVAGRRWWRGRAFWPSAIGNAPVHPWAR